MRRHVISRVVEATFSLRLAWLPSRQSLKRTFRLVPSLVRPPAPSSNDIHPLVCCVSRHAPFKTPASAVYYL